MSENRSEDIRQLLPELFAPAGKKKTPDGMCAPGAGCGPSGKPPALDIMRILMPEGAPSAPQADTAGGTATNEDAGPPTSEGQ